MISNFAFFPAISSSARSTTAQEARLSPEVHTVLPPNSSAYFGVNTTGSPTATFFFSSSSGRPVSNAISESSGTLPLSFCRCGGSTQGTARTLPPLPRMVNSAFSITRRSIPSTPTRTKPPSTSSVTNAATESRCASSISFFASGSPQGMTPTTEPSAVTRTSEV